jgi:hypothetical protein
MRLLRALGAALALVLVPASAASAQTNVDFELDHLINRGGAATSVVVSFVATQTVPDSPTLVVTRLQPGMQLKTRNARACDATDEELIAEGIYACPRRSHVGSGEALVRPSTGGAPFELTIAAFNGRQGDARQLVFYLTRTGAPADTVVIRATITGTPDEGVVLTTPIPSSCLPGDDPATPQCDNGEGVLTDFIFKTKRWVRNAGPRRRAFIRNPEICPSSGRWLHTVDVTFRSGQQFTLEDPAACKR